MPKLTDGELDELMAEVDGALAATPNADGVVGWPFGHSHDEKRAALARIKDRPPSQEQAEELWRALAVEEGGDITNEVMWGVLRAQGFMRRDEEGVYANSSDCVRVYEVALADAQSVRVRIALHQGFARFHPRGSNDGRMSTDDTRRLASKIDDSRSTDEIDAIVEGLRWRGRLTVSEWFDLANRWLDDPKRPPTCKQVYQWEEATEKLVAERPWSESHIRREAGSLLQRSLSRVENPDVIDRHLYLLASGKYGELHELPDHLPQLLIHDHWSVAHRAAELAKMMGDLGIRLLKEMVSTSPIPHTVSSCWSALKDHGLDSGALIALAAQNPNVDVVATAILGYHGRHWNALTLAWPILPAALRDALERRWRTDEERHHHPESITGFIRFLHRERGDSPLAAAAVSWINRPLWDVLGAHDFEAVSGLRRDDAVETRNISLLRFAYLADARGRRGEPLSSLLRRYDLDLDQLVAEEERYDIARDELAEVRRRLDEVAAEFGSDVLAEVRRPVDREDNPATRRLRDRFKELEFGTFANVARDFERLSRDVGLHAGGERFNRLFRASERLLPILREVGCSFAGTRGPDGILGEYQPVDRSITLFGPMIDLAAAEVAHLLGRSQEEVAPLVRTVVEVHEFAHAHLHLGRDARGGIWTAPGEGSVGHHEAVAQSYTRRLIAAMEVPGLADVLGVLEGWLPREYRFADLLDRVDGEDLRAWVVGTRGARPAQTLEDTLTNVIRALPGYLTLVASLVPGSAFEHLTGDLRNALARVEAKGSPEALVEVMSVVGALPHALAVLGPFVPGGWPTPDKLRWLLFEARIAGPPAGDRPLRFIKRLGYVRAVSSTRPAAQSGVLPSLRECNSTLSMLCAAAGRTEDDERHPDLPPGEGVSTRRKRGRR